MILKPDKVATLPGSYRPISLLPVIGKLMEKIMTQRIANLMIQKGLINKFQAGFQKGKSTTHQLLRLSEHITLWKIHINILLENFNFCFTKNL